MQVFKNTTPSCRGDSYLNKMFSTGDEVRERVFLLQEFAILIPVAMQETISTANQAQHSTADTIIKHNQYRYITLLTCHR